MANQLHPPSQCDGQSESSKNNDQEAAEAGHRHNQNPNVYREQLCAVVLGLVACFNSLGSIGANSCNAVAACDNSDGDIGANSCNNTASCCDAAVAIGDDLCNMPCECSNGTCAGFSP